MGYDVHITRRRSSSDEGPPIITLAEWQAAADMFPDLTVIDDNEAADEETRSMCRNGGSRIFFYSNGQISVKKPTLGAIRRMCILAKILDAKVIGDNDELYFEDGSTDKPTFFVPRENW